MTAVDAAVIFKGWKMYGEVLAHKYKVVKGQATLAAQILAATDIPASGSYVDVSGAIRVHVLMELGVIHASDTPTVQLKCSDAVGGTLDAITGIASHSIAADDDEEFISWTVEVSALPTDHHFLAIDVGGTTSNGSYGQAVFLLEMQDKPVTQTTTVLPAASQYYL